MGGARIRQAAAALIAVAALLLAATALAIHPAEAAITTPFTTRFDVNTNGSILLRGNTVLTCPSTPACTAARNGSGTGAALNNNNYTMIYTDADGDPIGTFNDSNSTITMPSGSTVLFAGLYWGASSVLPTRNQVRFRTPASASWTAVTATSLYASTSFYQGFADVTALVSGAGNGVYGVANIQASLGLGQYAGWSLAIAYRNPAEDMRSLRIFDGFGEIRTGALDIPITGFETPHSGTVHAKIGAVAYEGDLGNTGDSFEVDGRPLTDSVNPADNFFNSTVSESGGHVGGRDPGYQNTLGFDVDQVDASGMFGNGQLSTKLTLTTNGDTYYPGVITFSIDLYAPKLTTTVTGTDVDGGDLLPGDVIEYRIAVRNEGSDTADDVLLTDAIPPYTTYVPGSASASGSLSAGAVSWRLGNIPYLGTTYVAFRVTVDVGTPPGYAITNLVNVSYSGHTTSVNVAGLAGSVATPVLQPHVDRAAKLTVTPAFLQRAALPGNTAYTATVTNVSGDLEPATRAVLTLPTGITPDTLPAGCGAALPVVTCALGPLVAGSSASVTIPVVVDNTAVDRPVASLRAAGGGADSAAGNDADTAAIAVNSPPVAVADTATTTNNTAVNVPVLVNDSDPDDPGTALTVSIVSGPAQGAAVVVAADGSITYTPVPGWAGADHFDYQVADPNGGTDTARVTVTTANAAPTANPDMINTPPNTAVDLDVLVNDSDPNSDSLTVTGVTQPGASEGVATFTSTKVTFTPTSAFAGTSTFNYTISDGNGGTATGTISVDVANADPTAADDVLSVPAAASGVQLLVLANDTDPNGDSLTITAAGPAPGVSVAADGLSVLYTAPVGFAGAVTFPYSIDDGHGGTDTATVTLTVANARPTAYDFTPNPDYGDPVTIDAAFFSLDPNGDTLRVSGVTNPAHGTVSLDAYGKIVYVGDLGFSGTDSFSYTIDDGNGGTDTGHVTVTVKNGAPLARPDVVTAVLGMPLAIPVLANDDPDPNGDPLTITPTPLLPVGADGRVTYTPAGLGTDTFDYELDDGKGGTSHTTVTITTVNKAPVARADSAATDTNTAVTIAVLANDKDLVHGPPITLDAIGTGAHGTVTDNHDETLTYTPASGFYGTDSFLYSIRTPGGLTDSAVVTVTVRNAAPIAADDTFRVRADVATRLDLLANDHDPNTGQHLSVASVGTVAKGTLVLAADGTVTYRAMAGGIGPDGFTYVLTDDLGRTDTADVTITIDGKPTAVDDTATTAAVTAVDIRVLANDTDPEAQALTVVSAAAPGNGSTTVNPDGSVRYTPARGFSGVDSFGYTIRDPIGNTASARVRVQVANAGPIARPDHAAGLADRPLYIDVLANDEDPNPGQTLVVDAVNTAAHGTTEIVSGRVRFLPARHWTGQDTFAYRISDGRGGIAGSTVTVTISAGLPVAVADEASTPYRKPVTISVLANDLDPAGTLKVDSVTTPASGTAGFTSDSVTYTPPEGFGGPVTFGYGASDDAGNKTSAQVTVTVGAAPTVPDRSATAPPGGSVDVPLPHEDKGGRTVTVRSVGKPAHGTAVLNPDGTVTYTPDPGFNGVDTFTYEVVDENGDVATASIIVTVTAPPATNRPPIAAPDSVTMAAGDTVVVRPTLNDSDPDGDRVILVKLGKPAHGSVLAGAGDTVSYRPAAGFESGADHFEYTIADGRGGLATATVTIDVRALASLPVTGDDVLVLARAGLIAIAVGSIIYWMALPPKPRRPI